MTVTAPSDRSSILEAGRSRRIESSSMSSTTAGVDRGRLTVARRVVEKIASQVASEVSGVSGKSGGLFGVGARVDQSFRPQTGVVLVSDGALIDVEIGLPFPIALRDQATVVRSRIAEKVSRLAGVWVLRVDIRIVWLGTAEQGVNGRRELQ